MMSFHRLSLALLASAAALSAQAQQLVLGTPLLSGSGCQPGETSIILSPDQSVLSVLFSNFIATASKSDERQMQKTTCSMRIPVKVPDGYLLKVLKLDYRGFVSLPHNQAFAELITLHAFQATRGRRSDVSGQKKFAGPMEREISETHKLRDAWSSTCGAQTEILLQTNLTATNYPPGRRGPSGVGTAMITLDSIDAQSGVNYYLDLKSCR